MARDWEAQARFIMEMDPACKSIEEARDLYPVMEALRAYDEAHALYLRGEYYEARRISQEARAHTGIEIHPGAQIGQCLFIDHGMGVVIGETAEIGDYVHLYHGVTLGGVESLPQRRHPKLGNHVMVGAGATLLGAITIGDDAQIGAGAVVLQDVPAGATAIGVPARIIPAKTSQKAASEDPSVEQAPHDSTRKRNDSPKGDKQ